MVGPSSTLINVQILRGFAAYLVVVVHALHFLKIQGFGSGDVRFYGGSGVDLFFVISGFIMVYTTSGRPTRPGAFMASRIARVVPLYWLCTLALFTLALVLPSLLNTTRADPLWLAQSLLFIPFEKSPGIVQPMLFVGWTLNYEMFFYAVFAAFLLMPGRHRYLMLAAALVALVVAGRLLEPAAVPLRFYTDPILLEFAMGALIGVALPYLPVVRARAAIAALLALALVLAAILAFVSLPVHRVVDNGVPAALLVVVALVLERSGVVCPWRWPRLTGDISYSLYLTHAFVLYAVGHLALAVIPTAPLVPLLVTAAAVAGTTVASLVTFHLVERPATAWVRELLRPRPAAGWAGRARPAAGAQSRPASSS